MDNINLLDTISEYFPYQKVDLDLELVKNNPFITKQCEIDPDIRNHIYTRNKNYIRKTIGNGFCLYTILLGLNLFKHRRFDKALFMTQYLIKENFHIFTALSFLQTEIRMYLNRSYLKQLLEAESYNNEYKTVEDKKKELLKLFYFRDNCQSSKFVFDNLLTKKKRTKEKEANYTVIGQPKKKAIELEEEIKDFTEKTLSDLRTNYLINIKDLLI